MENILLEIIGTQHIDGQRDETHMTTTGTLEKYDKGYIVRYTEQQEPPFSPVDVTVDISFDERLVQMTRTGSGEARLIIEKSNRNLCRYGTDYGDILMGITGHSIENNIENDGGVFRFCYDIDLNGMLASKNEVKMTYRNNQE